MGMPNQFATVIHEAASADFTNYAYFGVYAGSGATPDINGVSVTMAAGSTIQVKLSSISSTAGVYVLGVQADSATGSTILGGTAFS